MLNQSDYLGVDAVTLSANIRAGDFTVSELTECAINRAEAVEPAINSIVTRNFNAAMDAAKNFDANPKLLRKATLQDFHF